MQVIGQSLVLPSLLPRLFLGYGYDIPISPMFWIVPLIALSGIICLWPFRKWRWIWTVVFIVSSGWYLYLLVISLRPGD